MSEPKPAYFRLPIVNDNQLVDIVAALLSVAKTLGGDRGTELITLSEYLVKQSLIMVQRGGDTSDIMRLVNDTRRKGPLSMDPINESRNRAELAAWRSNNK